METTQYVKESRWSFKFDVLRVLIKACGPAIFEGLSRLLRKLKNTDTHTSIVFGTSILRTFATTGGVLQLGCAASRRGRCNSASVEDAWQEEGLGKAISDSVLWTLFIRIHFTHVTTWPQAKKAKLPAIFTLAEDLAPFGFSVRNFRSENVKNDAHYITRPLTCPSCPAAERHRDDAIGHKRHRHWRQVRFATSRLPLFLDVNLN